ncbi:MAG: hypothetical protein ACRD09_07590 [Vicinamibacterales bacterium]
MRVEDVLQRIQGEYLEMPGLRLTADQARRLWGLEREVCASLLARLVDSKFLRQMRDGVYLRSDAALPRDVETAPAQTRREGVDRLMV